MSIALAAFVLGALLAVPKPAIAQDWTSIRGIRVVVDVRGGSKRSRNTVGRAIRRRLVEAIGPLVPSRELDAAAKKLKLSGKRTSSPRNLARAGLLIGAEHIIDVQVTSSRRGATVRARLVDVATAEVAFERTEKIKNVKRSGAKQGRVIGDELIKKLQAITNAYGGSVTASPPPPPPRDEATMLPEATITAAAPFSGSPDSGSPEATDPEPEPPTGTDPYAGIDDPAPDPSAGTTSTSDGKVKWFSAGGEVSQEPPAPPPPTTPAPPPPTKSDTRPTSANAVVTGPTSDERPPEFVRIGLRGGAGLARSYTLSTDEGSSSLSHSLDPVSMFELDFELRIPRANVGVLLRSAFRPVGYTVDRGSDGISYPAGLLIDFDGALRYHAAVLGEGADALEVIPSLGVRVSAANVDQHPANIIPSATTIAVRVGANMRYPVNEIFEVDGGLGVGLIVSYSEAPLGSGTSNGGFTFGGTIGASVWLTPYLGITFQNAVTYDAIAFSDTPERPLPPDEVGRLSDVSIAVFDVRSSAGIAFRF